MAKRKRNTTAYAKGFIPIRMVGGEIQGKVTNPSQKRKFKSLVTRIKKALSNKRRK